MADVRDSLFGLPQQGGAYIRSQIAGELFPAIGQQPGLWPFLSQCGPSAYVDLIQHSALQFSRASGGMTEVSPGVYAQAAVNERRYVWMNGRRGLLIEQAATNLLIYSTDLTAAGGITNIATTATTLTRKPANNTCYGGYVVAKAAAAIPYTFSIKVRRNGSGRYLAMRLMGNYPARADIAIDLSSGTLMPGGLSGVAPFVNQSYTITATSDGYWLITLTSVTDTAANLTCIITVFDSPQLYVDSGENSSASMDVAFRQLEATGFNTSHIPTSGSAATRAPDVPTIATAEFGFNPNEGTFVWDGYTRGDNPSLFDVNKGDASITLGAYLQTPGGVVAFESGGSSISYPEISYSVPFKFAETYSALGFSGSVNGGSVLSNPAPSTYPTVDRLNIGRSRTGSSQLNGVIFSLPYYPRKYSAAELQAAST